MELVVFAISQRKQKTAATVSRETPMKVDIIFIGGGHAGIEAANIAAIKDVEHAFNNKPP